MKERKAMSLVTTYQMLANAQRGGWAVGAFNVENAEMVRAVCAAAQSLKAPVILQTTPSTLRHLDCRYFAGLAASAAAEFGIAVALHLDHGTDYELCRRCIDNGYTSVMIDGSRLPFEENVSLSARVAAYARARGIPVEAELGSVGGKEDDMTEGSGQFTDPEQAAEFVRRTDVDSLAIGFGTAHGFYKTTPALDLHRVALVRERVNIPLVMHGTSGVSETDVRTAVRNGICKVNYATELREAFSSAVRQYLQEEPKTVDPKKYIGAAQRSVTRLVQERIAQLRPYE